MQVQYTQFSHSMQSWTQLQSGAEAAAKNSDKPQQSTVVELDKGQPAAKLYSPQTQALAAPQYDNSARGVANSILDFIEQRLSSERAAGADEAELQARLEEGLEGFETGYGEARDMLESFGVLDDELGAEIAQTHQLVSKGIAELAKEYSPSAADAFEVAEPAARESAELSARPIAEAGVRGPAQSLYHSLDISRERSFEFELTTREGDRISINAASFMRYAEAQAAAQTTAGSATAMSFSAAEEYAFDLTIEGDISDKEWQAFSELFNQVYSLAQDFYQGDVGMALEKALSLNYDSSEIAQFSVQLQQSSALRQTAAYEAVQSLQPDYHRPGFAQLAPLQDYAAQLLETLAEQDRLGLSADFVPKLLRNYGDTMAAAERPQLGEYLDQLLQLLPA
ncbi:MAG: DUF5610 domain-containing protein [Cellvibrionaceae bacterium]|nr:DUF5610 domain-containing protein [Cellvibrionaceae bacterium]